MRTYHITFNTKDRRELETEVTTGTTDIDVILSLGLQSHKLAWSELISYLLIEVV